MIPFSTPLPAQELWMADALCRQVDQGDLWFGDAGENASEAIRICRMCPVQTSCLEYAIEHNEKWGVWGARTPRSRQELASARRRNHGRECRVCGQRFQDGPNVLECSRKCRLEGRRRRERRPA